MFWIIAAIVLISALAVVCLPNPLHSALCLATNLVAVAALYAMLGAHFLAAVQITVYAGAIMVLVIFVIMLLNIKKEKFHLFDLGLFLFALAAVSFCAFIISDGYLLYFTDRKVLIANQQALSLTQLGIELFARNPLFLQLSGVLLVTALVGAVLLASQRRIARVAQGQNVGGDSEAGDIA